MWRTAVVVTPIAAEPLALADVKARLRVDADDDDGVIWAMVSESRDHAERYCGARIAPITLALRCSSFADFSDLPEAPLLSVVSIAYVDAEGAGQTLPDTVYEALAGNLVATIALKPGQSWPGIQRGSWITVTAQFGFDPLPPALSRALMLHIADAYDVREDKPAGPFTAVDALLCNFRR